jgi:hypothetical protein
MLGKEGYVSEHVFFIAGRITSDNKGRRMRWQARYSKEKKAREVWAIQFQAIVPRAILVDSPHRPRAITLKVFRNRSLDWDNLVAGLKPFIDVLKCKFFKGRTSDPNMLTWRGVIYDDSPKYVTWNVPQRTIHPSEGPWKEEGVEVKVEGI